MKPLSLLQSRVLPGSRPKDADFFQFEQPGSQILAREGQALAQGTPLGANLQLLSGATSDSEEAIKQPKGAIPSSRWNRLQDDHL